MEWPAGTGRRGSPGGALSAALRAVQPGARSHRVRSVVSVHAGLRLYDGARGWRRAADAASARYSPKHSGARIPPGVRARTGSPVSSPKHGPRDGVRVDDFHRTSVEHDVLILLVAEIRAAGFGCRRAFVEDVLVATFLPARPRVCRNRPGSEQHDVDGGRTVLSQRQPGMRAGRTRLAPAG